MVGVRVAGLKAADFFKELLDFLDYIGVYNYPLMIEGDFNTHRDCQRNPDSSTYLKRHVQECTHIDMVTSYIF